MRKLIFRSGLGVLFFLRPWCIVFPEYAEKRLVSYQAPIWLLGAI
jgi:hypothetical protein